MYLYFRYTAQPYIILILLVFSMFFLSLNLDDSKVSRLNTNKDKNVKIALGNLTGSPEGPSFPGFPSAPYNQ